MITKVKKYPLSVAVRKALFYLSAELSGQMFTPEALKMMLEEETCLVSLVLDKTVGNRALAGTTSIGEYKEGT